MNFQEAKFVEVVTKKGKFKGFLLPEIELLGKDAITLKLENGYNIRILKKDIKRIRILKRYRKQGKRGKKIRRKEGLPNVSILATGGTIASRVDYLTGGVYASFDIADLASAVPEILEIANLKSKVIMQVMSEDMNPELWKKMAREVYKELRKRDVDGVVITHGTDTMHFSSALFSFIFQNLNKPIVFTGAQRSSDRGSSDTFMNLFCSVKAATLDLAEVTLCMHASMNDDYCYLHRGCKVRKMHTSRRDAFRSINDKPIAKIYSNGEVEFINENYRKRSEAKGGVKLDLKLEPKVALIYVYPGMDPKVIDFYLNRGYRGIVIAGTGLGHVPTTIKKYSLIGKFKKAYEKGVAICITSQCLYGRVNPSVYANLRRASIEGRAIYCEDMLPEVAYCKLMWVLGKTKKLEKVRELMLTNVAGEINKRSEIDTFLI